MTERKTVSSPDLKNPAQNEFRVYLDTVEVRDSSSLGPTTHPLEIGRAHV